MGASLRCEGVSNPLTDPHIPPMASCPACLPGPSQLPSPPSHDRGWGGMVALVGVQAASGQPQVSPISSACPQGRPCPGAAGRTPGAAPHPPNAGTAPSPSPHVCGDLPGPGSPFEDDQQENCCVIPSTSECPRTGLCLALVLCGCTSQADRRADLQVSVQSPGRQGRDGPPPAGHRAQSRAWPCRGEGRGGEGKRSFAKAGKEEAPCSQRPALCVVSLSQAPFRALSLRSRGPPTLFFPSATLRRPRRPSGEEQQPWPGARGVTGWLCFAAALGLFVMGAAGSPQRGQAGPRIPDPRQREATAHVPFT